MGEYLTIIWDTTAPTPAAVSWDNSMLIVKGSEATLSESTLYAVTADNWSSVLTNAGFSTSSQAYKSTADYYAASPTPGGDLYVMALVSGTVDTYNNVSLEKVEENLYETPIKPPLGFAGEEQVRYYPDADETGYFINTADGNTGLGFTVVDDSFGNWTGRLDFISGLSGFQIDDPLLDGSKVTASFTVGSQMGDLGDNLEQYGINMMAAAYANTTTKEDYPAGETYFGTQTEDLSRFMSAIAGKNTIFFWALPGAADPKDTASGFGDVWYNIRTNLGAREDVALIKATPSATEDDMAAGYMGMTAGEHPHTTLTFKTLHMGISGPEGKINRSYWNDAQVASPMQRRELAGNPNLITHGFTLGSGYSSRINYVRCKYIIDKELTNTLWALLASRKVRMSYQGMQLVKSTIQGLFKTLTDQGIVDGLAYVRIPIEIDLKNNTAAGKAARAAREIPSIEIGFYWYSSLEKITITGLRNEA